jgi:hypothetical protein
MFARFVDQEKPEKLTGEDFSAVRVAMSGQLRMREI